MQQSFFQSHCVFMKRTRAKWSRLLEERPSIRTAVAELNGQSSLTFSRSPLETLHRLAVMPYAHECGCRIVYDRVPSPLPAENLSQGLVHIEGYPENTYFWPLTETQSRRLSSLLDIDFNSLGIAGSLIQSPELICTYCGKLSGLEDFVHAALQTGVHSADFVIENLKAGGNSPNGHKQILNCCDCGRPYLRSGTDEEVATRVGAQAGGSGFADNHAADQGRISSQTQPCRA
ncbi:hypothetical protein CALVIDRAFT_114591 [Calocera viscosa TUFC12733]|uniref:Uncharacterized protein n=1 Tax=Calocera viscosa (strain TUFC12733) TaxID=1330018 RepID=A0A167M637_CALVF|nr:hypothetical protein CALVIDRAFT_114591 [Calocera viscosa TUFC12733]